MGTVEPWKFGLALAGLGIVWFFIPPKATFAFALLFILGALYAANREAETRGIESPLDSIRF